MRILVVALSISIAAGCARKQTEAEIAVENEAATEAGPAPQRRMMPTPFYQPGIRLPSTIRGDKAKLADDTDVVGVVVDGHARAYVLEEMRYMATHVVNDRVGDLSITVTYCDQQQTVRTFCDPKATEPLRVDLGGYAERMIVRIGQDMFWQDTGESLRPNGPSLPLEVVQHERTTWKAWKEKHPDTDVVTNLQPPKAKNSKT